MIKEKRLRPKRTVLAHYQRAASEQGEQFAAESLLALRLAGFEIVETKLAIPEVGIEVDAHTMNAHGISMFWEFKGSLQGDRPGSRRMDTLKKAIANGYLFSRSNQYQCCAPLVLLTSHVPKSGAGLAMLTGLDRSIFFDVLAPKEHGKRLRWIANADRDMLEDDKETHQLIDLVRRQWGIG